MDTIPKEPTIKIPIIDINGYIAGSKADKIRVTNEFRSACQNEGFLQVAGHRIPQDLINRFLSVLAEFFALPLEEKEKISFKNSPCNRGYEHLGSQKLDLDVNVTADQKESFSARADRPGGRFLQGMNQWPDRPVDFRAVYTEYYEAVHGLSKMLFRIMALSLDLEESYFDDFASDPDGLCRARAHHYPPTLVDTTGNTRGVGAHTDFGAMTLLLQDDGKYHFPALLSIEIDDIQVGGLEVLHKETGIWLNVNPVPGAFVVNIGDLMQRWTNDRYKSTMHRLISPKNGKDRYSCAFFNDGVLDQVIECIPSCLNPGEKPVYEPLRVEDHLKRRFLQSYGDAGVDLKL